jgi:hypothetical protein
MGLQHSWGSVAGDQLWCDHPSQDPLAGVTHGEGALPAKEHKKVWYQASQLNPLQDYCQVSGE